MPELHLPGVGRGAGSLGNKAIPARDAGGSDMSVNGKVAQVNSGGQADGPPSGRKEAWEVPQLKIGPTEELYIPLKVGQSLQIPIHLCARRASKKFASLTRGCP